MRYVRVEDSLPGAASSQSHSVGLAHLSLLLLIDLIRRNELIR